MVCEAVAFCHVVELPCVQHDYFRPVASEVLQRYRGEGGQPRVINSLVPDEMTIGDNSLILNCDIKVS